ncbi:lipopolysaccharide biosynthesis protein [Marinobacter xestospongiae]|uniref:lipopolysaccharide biosynthesis protein n=1 Tax=Marinobacter xestospongiae TaxID=994319 RepID=UPI0020043DA1|nr:hypothetical protein [Marinobacter xestospongiae]MCK7569148.1 hypothetical protein [Marinobacter xestospongiae]
MKFQVDFKKILESDQSIALIAQAVRVSLLAFYLVLSTRMLGAEGYGHIVVAISISTFFIQFVGLGSGLANIRDASRNPDTFSRAWGIAFVRYFTSGILLAVAYIALGVFFVGDEMSWLVWTLVAVSEVLIFPISIVSVYAFMSYGMVRRALVIQVIAPLLKTGILFFGFLALEKLSVEDYVLIMFFSSTLASILCVFFAFRLLPPISWPSLFQAWKVRSDILYPINSLTNQGVAEGSKPVTMLLYGAYEAGHFGAAMRVVSALAMPVTSVIQSQAYRLFSYGNSIKNEHFIFLVRYSLFFFIYSLACFSVIWFLSEYIEVLLGDGFENVSNLVLVLTVWLPAYSLRQIIGAVLTTTDKTGSRILLDILSFFFFLWLMLYSFPGHGPMGTAISVVISEYLWCALSFGVFYFLKRR